MIPGYTKEAFIKLAAQKPAYTRTRPQGVKLKYMPSVGQMYDAFEYAETGTLVPKGKQYWMRTRHAPPKGSSAFGPVQTTRSLVMEARKNHPVFDTRYGKWYDSSMGPMQKKFLFYGKEPHKKGYDINYEYGGHGYWDQKNNDMYKKMNHDLLRLTRMDSDKKWNKLPAAQRTVDSRVSHHIGQWRGASKSDDPHYYDKVLDNLYSKYPGLFDNYDESKIDARSMQQRQQRLKQMNESWIFK